MNCRSAESLFSALIEDELSQAERRALEAHLLRCRDCSTSVRELRETMTLMRSLPAVETSGHFEADVLERVRSGEALRPSVLEWLSGLLAPVRLRPVLAASAGVCAVAIAAIVVLRAPEPPGVTPQAPSSASTSGAPASPRPAAGVPAPPAPTGAPASGSAPGAVAAGTSMAAARPSGGEAVPATSNRLRRLTPEELARAMRPDAEGFAADSGLELGRPIDSRYQDEYILDQFLLERAPGRRDPSMVPAGGTPDDDVFITF